MIPRGGDSHFQAQAAATNAALAAAVPVSAADAAAAAEVAVTAAWVRRSPAAPSHPSAVPSVRSPTPNEALWSS
jgi:hypothetical protein